VLANAGQRVVASALPDYGLDPKGLAEARARRDERFAKKQLQQQQTGQSSGQVAGSVAILEDVAKGEEDYVDLFAEPKRKDVATQEEKTFRALTDSIQPLVESEERDVMNAEPRDFLAFEPNGNQCAKINRAKEQSRDKPEVFDCLSSALKFQKMREDKEYKALKRLIDLS
jgi:hypothetical protein